MLIRRLEILFTCVRNVRNEVTHEIIRSFIVDVHKVVKDFRNLNHDDYSSGVLAFARCSFRTAVAEFIPLVFVPCKPL
jgi:hypothetical protein